MNILDRINGAKASFTKSDEQIYNCIKNDYWTVIRDASNIIDLANKCGVSKSAVLRFAKKLGYSGYSEFKHDFTLAGHSEIPSGQSGTKQDIIIDHYCQSIQEIKNQINDEELTSLAKELVKASKLRICGSNRSGLTATQFKYRLLQIGLEAEAISDSLLLKNIINNSSNEEVYIFFTVRGNNSTPLNAYIKDCFENNHKIILVTMNPTTSFKKYASRFIVLPNIKINGLFVDEQAIYYIFIEILTSYISEQMLLQE